MLAVNHQIKQHSKATLCLRYFLAGIPTTLPVNIIEGCRGLVLKKSKCTDEINHTETWPKRVHSLIEELWRYLLFSTLSLQPH